MLKQTLKTDLNAAMKEKNSTKVGTLRLLLSAIQYFEIQKERDYQANDQEVLTLVEKEVKKRRESIDLYTQGNRPELAEKEAKELEILQSYLPKQMSEDEMRKLVTQAVAQSGAQSPQDIGKVMGILMPQVKGKADGGLVSKIVREELNASLRGSVS
ncbi:MAG: GatB/YqeY domain-containing protein [Candidatus Roizmanbacteria bacterium]|nr:GatB/YqeY domain-containing protein [Candidatus Roizmanbacteria bacterium]